MRQEALIAFMAPSSSGVNALEMAIVGAQRFLDIVELSPCYARTSESGDFTVAARAHCQLETNDFAGEIKILERKQNLPVKIRILTLGAKVQMDPKLVLPHPSLTAEATVLVAASEVWGELGHPILEKTLSELRLGVANTSFDLVRSKRDMKRLISAT